LNQQSPTPDTKAWGGYLTQELRQNMNDMVDEMNTAIQKAVAQAAANFGDTGKQIVFYNSDPLFDGHRFCTPGKSYTNSWIFLPAGYDEKPDGTLVGDTLASQGPTVDLYTYGLTCNQTTNITAAYGNQESDLLCVLAIWVASRGDWSQLNTTADPTAFSGDSTTKTMHPKSIAQYYIAQRVYTMLQGFYQGDPENS
jgi:hypothetical protein